MPCSHGVEGLTSARSVERTWSAAGRLQNGFTLAGDAFGPSAGRANPAAARRLPDESILR
jgi:hypothetical protein